MPYWNKFIVHKCKQRLTKLTEMLRRMRKLKLRGLTTLTTVKQKTERRDVARMEKAEQRAYVETEIEKELLDRLKLGTYGELYEDLLNLNKAAFNRHLEDNELADEEEARAEFEESLDEIEVG